MAFSVVWLDSRSTPRMDVKYSTRLSDFIRIDKMLGLYNDVGSGRYFIPKDAKLGGL